ncbi:hypothetical protein K3495_g1669 [Podosphaera aphanis]|nr:hypothetical protein K3495_g1669 [Podosphaera aphanis]
MDELLKPVSTSYRSTPRDSQTISLGATAEEKKRSSKSTVATPEDALDVLRNEPDYQSLISVLSYLCKKDSNFSISIPSPISAQLIHVLVSRIVPTFWGVITGTDGSSSSEKKFQKEPSAELQLFISCLQSVTGINAVILCLKQLIQQSEELRKPTQCTSAPELIKIWLGLLDVLLSDRNFFKNVWGDLYQSTENPAQKILWKEFLKIVGSNKIVGICAEAEKYVNDLSKINNKQYWVADGRKYSIWLADNIARWAKNPSDTFEACLEDSSELLSKSLFLGYNETIVKGFINNLLLQGDDCSVQFSKVISGLKNSEQGKILYSLLKICSTKYLSDAIIISESTNWWISDASLVSAVAALIRLTINESDERKAHLIAWLSSPTGAGLGYGIAIRRSVMATVANDRPCLEKILENCLQQFGDRPYIRHTPTLQQDVHCQVLLLAAGYVHRNSPNTLKMMVKSGSYLNLVSNRLSSSSTRIRFLGMIVGEALSGLVDKEENRMDFKVPDLKTSEAKWLKSLVEISDSVGSLDLLKSKSIIQVSGKIKAGIEKQPAKVRMASAQKPMIHDMQPVKILEEDIESDDLVSYSKPDSDPEDSDDDPTVINRNKPTAPVYIRDLITYLRDTESYDHQRLGLSTAAQLIRRKANFGTEVTDHAEELATLLVGIQDKYEIEDFAEMRLQGMIAVLIANPFKLGPWFSNTFFSGDYSISQRSSILTTLGLGAREIGGLGAEDAVLSSYQKQISTDLFPSKKLPSSMEKHFTENTPQIDTHLDALSSDLEKSMILPMATTLADKLTGPSILKVRTFSSRMQVQNKRSKPTTNPLAKLVAESFIFPLIGRFLLHLNSYTMSTRSVVFQPYLLSHFIKTLALILHAAGPFTPSLPQMTAEFWDVLLKLRVSARDDRVVCEALCFALLTLLELNADKVALVHDHGQKLLETQEWIRIVLEATGDGSEDERCRMLATGCLVKIHELVEKHQRVLMGSL